jgi:deferrochelatase/peroxidase EfeB
MTAAALERVQAHVLRQAGPKLTRTAFYFLTLEEPGAGRGLLARLLEEKWILSDAVARRRARDNRIDRHVAVGFTRDGLERLGHCYDPHPNQVVRPDNAEEPDNADAFGQGMPARAGLLGDPVASHWQGAGCNMLLWIAAEDEASEHAVDQVVRASGVEVRLVERGAARSDPPIALGFRDGTGQPYLSEMASSRDRLPGGGTLTPDGWRPVPLGEFVMGYTDAGGERIVPSPQSLATGGTFLVYRKYEFDVAAIDKFLDDAGRRYDRALGRTDGGVATVAAKLVGRYRDGESPAGWPDGYDAAIVPTPSGRAAPTGANDFRYGQDTYGHACPLGAHIRRANPRDALGFDGRLTERHRILRRSVLWEDGGREGLHFVCVNARIHDQFEFIQRQWFNTGSAFRLGRDVDLLAGSWPEPDEQGRRAGAGSFVIQGTHPVFLRAEAPLTEMQGGDYFLMPGVDGVRTLAGIDA